jgi:F0F1-type ATP synthase epsilon subunit
MNTPYTQEISLTIRNRTQVIFNGPVKAITSSNLKGRFDVLPQHANFISIIKDYVTVHKVDGTESQLKISRGVLKVNGNSAAIYLGVVRETKPTPPLPVPAK